MAPPNAFNNELEKLVFNKYIGSVVIVEFHKKDYSELKKQWNKVSPIGGSGNAKKKALQENEANLQAVTLCSTSFVVKVEEIDIFVLTCVHVLKLLSTRKIQSQLHKWKHTLRCSLYATSMRTDTFTG